MKRRVTTLTPEPFGKVAKGAWRALAAEAEGLVRLVEPDARASAVARADA